MTLKIHMSLSSLVTTGREKMRIWKRVRRVMWRRTNLIKKRRI